MINNNINFIEERLNKMEYKKYCLGCFSNIADVDSCPLCGCQDLDILEDILPFIPEVV